MCIAGFYSDVGETECHVCEANYKCPTPYKSDRVACDDGWWSMISSVNCYPVGAHMQFDNTASLLRPTSCKFGEISATANHVCEICAQGYECASDNLATEECTGSYDNRFVSEDYEIHCYKKQMTWYTGATSSP